MNADAKNSPALPRRVFVAATLSGIFAASLVALGIFGNVDKPDMGTFQFSRGLSFANGEEQRLRGLLSRALLDDRIQVKILGHTGTAGNAEANQNLSVERATAATKVADGLGIERDRIDALGLGGSAPLQKSEDESDRAYQSRLARVEVILQVQR